MAERYCGNLCVSCAVEWLLNVLGIFFFKNAKKMGKNLLMPTMSVVPHSGSHFCLEVKSVILCCNHTWYRQHNYTPKCGPRGLPNLPDTHFENSMTPGSLPHFPPRGFRFSWSPLTLRSLFSLGCPVRGSFPYPPTSVFCLCLGAPQTFSLQCSTPTPTHTYMGIHTHACT